MEFPRRSPPSYTQLCIDKEVKVLVFCFSQAELREEIGTVKGKEETQESWPEREMSTANFGDARLQRRAQLVLAGLSQRPDGSIPAAFCSWAETQAACRLFSNEKVTAERVLEPHRDAALKRVETHPVVLCVQDTTELDYTSKSQI